MRRWSYGRGDDYISLFYMDAINHSFPNLDDSVTKSVIKWVDGYDSGLYLTAHTDENL